MWARPVKKAKPMTFCIIKMLVDEVLGQDVYRTFGHFKVPIVEWRTVINIIAKFYSEQLKWRVRSSNSWSNQALKILDLHNLYIYMINIIWTNSVKSFSDTMR